MTRSMTHRRLPPSRQSQWPFDGARLSSFLSAVILKMLRLTKISIFLCLLVGQIRPGVSSTTRTKIVWRSKLMRDLLVINDGMTPPILQGQSEKDMRINLTISEIRMFEVEFQDNDAFVTLFLRCYTEWFAPAFRWPPEFYGNLTELDWFSGTKSYIRSNFLPETRGAIRIQSTGKALSLSDAHLPLDCEVSRWFPSMRLHCEQELKFTNAVGDLLEFGCTLGPIFISDSMSVEWKLRKFTCVSAPETYSKVLIFDLQHVIDTRGYEMMLVLVLSFMHGLVPSERPERALLSGASLVTVFVFLLSPMCQSDPWWQAFSGLWSRLLCAHVLLTLFRLAPGKLGAAPEKIASNFLRSSFVALPTAVQELSIYVWGQWRNIETMLMSVYPSSQTEDYTTPSCDVKLRFGFIVYHMIELCLLLSV